MTAFDHGDDARALKAFERLRDDYPELGDYHLAYIGRIHLRHQRNTDATRAFNMLLVHYPRSVHAASAALEVGRLLATGDNTTRASEYLKRAVYLDDGEFELEARLELAKLEYRTADAATAHGAFVELRREARGTEVGRVAKEYVTTLRRQHPQLAPAGREALDEAKLLLAERDFNAALFLAKSVAAQRPELRVEAEFVEANALFGLDESDRAFTTLWEVVEANPRHPQAAAALYEFASKLWNRDRDAAALRAFTRYLTLYPRGPKRLDARYAIARIHDSARRTDDARTAYRDLIRSAPGHALANEARWRLGWIEYRAGEWFKAAEHFAELVERTTGGERDGAMYWRARCHQQLGNGARARSLYAAIAKKRSYYGMWAARRIAQIEGQGLPSFSVRRLATASTVKPPPHPGRPPEEIDAFHWNRFVELHSARLPHLAHAELVAVEEAAGSRRAVKRFLFDAYRAVGRYDDALRLMGGLGSALGLDSAERRHTLYPLAFWDVVRDEAHGHQVDPLLVLALMRQESLFDPEARSPAKAVGLLQLLPSTAERVAVSVDNVDPTRLTDPATNVRLGVAYLGSLLDRYNGDPFRALAAYNGGEDAVEKWRQRWPQAEGDEFVESITYRETRDYVKKVLGNYIEYRELYD